MSYAIFFIQKKGLNLNRIYPILETHNPSPSEDFYISPEKMEEVAIAIQEKGLKFNFYNDEESFELVFPTYNVAIYSSQIVITLPFWKTNKEDKITAEINSIINLLIEFGFTGFDQQTERFITKKNQFQNDFNKSKDMLSNVHSVGGFTYQQVISILLVAFIVAIASWLIYIR